MVLEGLKKAQYFITLLQQLGYKRENGKMLKAEQFDQEFAGKLYGPVLSALLIALESRILTVEEQELLNYLEENGFLTGLIEESKVQNTTISNRNIKKVELQALEAQNAHLQSLLDEGDLRQRQLEVQLDKVQRQLDDLKISPLPTLPILVKGTTDDINNILPRLQELLEETKDTILKVISVTLPDSQFDIAPVDPLLLSTIDNDEIIQRGWSSEAESFYLGKIASGIARLDTDYGLKIDETALMTGERQLTILRRQYLEVLYEVLERYSKETLGVMALWNAINLAYQGHWKPFQRQCESMGKSLLHHMTAIEYLLSHSLYSDPIISETFHPLNQQQQKNYKLTSEQVAMAINKLDSFVTPTQTLTNRLILPNGEVNIVPGQLREREETLRGISNALSQYLQVALTEAEKLKSLSPLL